METLRSLLELFGAFDQAVIEDDDPHLASTVDQVFPGSAANKGWYQELETYFFSETSTGPRQRPDAAEALQRLSAAAQVRPLTTVQKSQVFLNLVSLYRVQQVTGTTTLPDYGENQIFRAAFDQAFDLLAPPPEDPDPSASSIQPSTVRRDAPRLAQADDAEVDGDEAEADGADEQRPAGDVGTSLPEFLDEVISLFETRSDYSTVANLAADVGLIERTVAEVPLCDAYLATVNGLRCVVVDTEFTSDKVSFERVLGIVNPFNWALNYPDFFCGMSGCAPPRSDGWGRVIERVSFCGWKGARGLSTALKFLPTKLSDTDARLDYDLDDPTPGPGDGQVRVDRGYVNITSTALSQKPTDPGVRVCTRKVVHIDNVSPYAQAKLVCITGYGSASIEFICGAADIRPPGPKPFDYLGKDQTGTGTPAPADPPHAVPAAVQIWTDTLQDVTKSYIDLAEKWTTGGLKVEDLADYSTKVGGRLISTPWEILRAVTQPRPPSTGPTKPDQGQGGGS